jgi:hypothetical protein
MRTRPKRTGTEVLGLQELADQLKEWRRTRIRGQRIPQEFWKAATALARVHGLNPTAAALKLNYYDLQGRFLGQGERRKRPGTRAPFVELAPPLAPSAAEPGTLEFIEASGARLTLRLPKASPKALLPLVRLFLRPRL